MSARIKAEALAKAALQATARAMHTAQLAHDAYRRADGLDYGAAAGSDDEARMGALRDTLLDAYSAIPDEARKRLLASKGTITSDELIDLLAMCVKG
jgi:hypothetical protein